MVLYRRLFKDKIKIFGILTFINPKNFFGKKKVCIFAV